MDNFYFIFLIKSEDNKASPSFSSTEVKVMLKNQELVYFN